MKKNPTHLLLMLAMTLLLGGCSTSRRTAQWEYKVAPPDNNRAESPETFLNVMAKDGWILVQKDSNGSYIFKRPRN